MDLYYQSVGQGTPIVFIHGFTLDSRMWKPQVDYFQKTNQVITYDMRGFGKSPLPTASYNHVEDLHSLVQDLNLSQFHLIGLSLGGEIAQEYALTYPASLLSLTLVDTSLGGYPSTVDWRVYAKEQGLARAKQNWLNHPVFASTKSNPLVFANLKEMVDTYSGWHWLNEGYRIKLDPPAKDRLSEIKIPTQIILGELDLSYYHDIAKILTDEIPNAKLHIIKNAGHMTNLENAAKFNYIINSFINTQEA